MTVGEFTPIFISKADLYSLMTQQSKRALIYGKTKTTILHITLPSIRRYPVRFMKQILAGSKKVCADEYNFNSLLDHMI